MSLLAAACRRPPYDVAGFPLPDSSAVALLPAADYATDFADLIYRGLTDFKLPLRGRRVLLKPNMVEYEQGTAINTHPLVIAGAAVACRRAGATEVVVGEGPGHRRDIEYLLSASGLGEHLHENAVRFVDLNVDDVKIVPLRSWFTGARELALPVELLKADVVISMPKLKTHSWAGMTCSMKNLFGVVPGAVYGWPKNVLHFQGITNTGVQAADPDSLPSLELEQLPTETRLSGEPLQEALVLGAAPPPLAPLIEGVRVDEDYGVEVTLRGGGELHRGERRRVSSVRRPFPRARRCFRDDGRALPRAHRHRRIQGLRYGARVLPIRRIRGCDGHSKGRVGRRPQDRGRIRRGAAGGFVSDATHVATESPISSRTAASVRPDALVTWNE